MGNIFKYKVIFLMLFIALILTSCEANDDEVNIISDVNNVENNYEDDNFGNIQDDEESSIKKPIENDIIKTEEAVIWLGEYEQQKFNSINTFCEDPFITDMLVVKKDNKFGVIGIDGKEIIPIIYDEIGFFSSAFGGFYSYFFDGKTMVKKGDKWACMSKDGKLITEFIYDKIEYFSEGFAAVKRDGKWGFIDKNGQEVIAPIHANVGIFRDSIASVSMGDKEGAIDTEGNLVIPYDYDSAIYFSYGLGIVKSGDKYGCIDKEDNIIIPFAYERISIIDDKIIAVFDYGIVNFLNFNGELISQYEYFEYGGHFAAYATPLIDNKYVVAKIVNDRPYFGVMNDEGTEIIPFIYTAFGNLSEELIVAAKGGEFQFVGPEGKYGFIDINGNEIISFDYTSAGSFSEGFAAVEKGGKWGYIDKEGKVIIPFMYDGYCTEFSNGLAFAQINGKYGVINKEGKEITEFIYDNWSSFKYDIAGVAKEGKYGYIDKNGHEIVPAIYDFANYYPEQNVVIVEKDGKLGYVKLKLKDKNN